MPAEVLRRSAEPHAISFTIDGDWEGELDLAIPIGDISSSDDVVLVYFEELIDQWLPIESRVEAGRVVATVEHLTDFDLWDAASYVNYSVRDVFGDRTDAPECADDLPDWARSFIANEERNETVRACAEASGENIAVKISANRGVGITLTSNVPILVATTTGTTDIDSSIASAFTAGVRQATQNKTFVYPSETVTLFFSRPALEQVQDTNGAIEIQPSIDRIGILGDLVAKTLRALPLPANDMADVFACVVAVIETSSSEGVDAVREGLGAVVECTEPFSNALDGQSTAAFRQIQYAWTSFDLIGELSDAYFLDVRNEPSPVTVFTRIEQLAAEDSTDTSGSPGWATVSSARIPSLCGFEAAELVNGSNPSIGNGDGFLRLLRETMITDVPANEGSVTAVVAECGAGDGVPSHLLVLFDAVGYSDSSSLADDEAWSAIGLTGPAPAGMSTLEYAGETLRVRTLARRDQDPPCCPSAEALVSVDVRSGDVRVVSVELIEADPAELETLLATAADTTLSAAERADALCRFGEVVGLMRGQEPGVWGELSVGIDPDVDVGVLVLAAQGIGFDIYRLFGYDADGQLVAEQDLAASFDGYRLARSRSATTIFTVRGQCGVRIWGRGATCTGSGGTTVRIANVEYAVNARNGPGLDRGVEFELPLNMELPTTGAEQPADGYQWIEVVVPADITGEFLGAPTPQRCAWIASDFVTGTAVNTTACVLNFEALGQIFEDPKCVDGWALVAESFANNVQSRLFRLEGSEWVEVDAALTCCRDTEIEIEAFLERNGAPLALLD